MKQGSYHIALHDTVLAGSGNLVWHPEKLAHLFDNQATGQLHSSPIFDQSFTLMYIFTLHG